MKQRPQKTDLPFLPMGFSAGEPAYHQIERFVDACQEYYVERALIRIDGLPYLTSDQNNDKMGYRIFFKKQNTEKAYEKICDFYPERLYKWEIFTDHEDKSQTNVLVGHNWSYISDFEYIDSWSAKEDPIFGEAIKEIEVIIDKDANDPFDEDSFDWSRLFRLQMAYLLLWTSLERFLSFRYAIDQNLSVGQKLNRLSGERAFHDAFDKVLIRQRMVIESQDRKKPIELKKGKYTDAIKYYHQVRNNLVHRGKGAERDGEILKLSLKELHQILKAILDETLFY